MFKKLIHQLKKRKKVRGNTSSRSKTRTVGLDASGTRTGKHPIPSWMGPGQLDTKFMLRPKLHGPKLKWKHYPIPHVWENPRPEGARIYIYN